MPSDLQVSNLKALDGTAGISIADSTGNITLNNPITTGTFNGTIGDSAVLSDSYYLQAKLDNSYTSTLPKNINFDESTSPYWVFTSDSDWHVSGTGSNFSQGTTASDLKIHRAGIYLVNYSVTGYETSAERNLNISIRGVGSGSTNELARSLDQIAIEEGSTNYGNASSSLIYKFNADDQINFYVTSAGNNTANLSVHCHFNICLIRPL